VAIWLSMPASDAYSRKKFDMGMPATNAVAVTPSDSVDLSYVSRAVYVGASGNVKVVMADSGTVTFVGVPAGATLPIRVSRIWSTGTTATNIIALW